jgi:type IV pilus assembly protein PilP
MLKHNTFIRFVAGLVCLFFLFVGCDNQAEAPPKPKVITKKIIARKDVSLPPKTKTTKPKQSVAKQKRPKPEAKTALAKAPQPKAAAKAQPVLKPKGETAVKQAPTPKIQPLADTTKAKPAAENKKLVASLAPTVQASKLLLKDVRTYNPEGKLDPFAPLFEEKRVGPVVATRPKKKAKKRVPLTPLEKVDLSQLKVVAIIRALSGNKAMVTEASGKGYIVKKGTLIGTRSGKIVEILTDRIVVEEETEDIYGKVSVKKRSLQIQKPLGE